ncbi:oligosaccharide flippase family protein [Gynuella sunshinyii]|uniref:Membrane protein involved in the export of O-antigen and teichoic acid n=1 Tax=Gynuella sunshinyii YC6258 TaxID=1445510 RepID=A0A0C5VF85_9GAMM|nr:oligosaccharide flippase family protein [Gynuella sunshinyii]AJQ92816.1 membrane protein involved in the export of O-antigen and teichoic acid [Gynuella sunshinyii YC6258]
MNFKNKTVLSTFIVMAGFASGQIIRFGGNLITTRFLAPDLFGVMAIANAVVYIVLLFSDMGFGLSIIRSERGEEPRFLKTVFSFKVLQGIALSVFVYVAALCIWGADQFSLFPPESTFGNKDLPLALIIVALCPIIGGFKSIQMDLHIRHQKIGRQTIIELTSQILALLFIIGYAQFSSSIFTLAFSNVVAAACTMILSYVLFDRSIFGFAWDKETIKEVLFFGKWIQASSAIVGLLNHVDKIFFGYLMTTTQMGIYSIASLMFAAMGNIFNRMNVTLLPAISKVVREKPQNLSKVYYKIKFYRDLIIAIPASIIIANGDIVVSLIYDERYHQAGYFLQIMSIAHLIECLLFKEQVITALGASKVHFQMSLWRFAGVIILIPLCYHFFGTTGIILAFSCRRLFGSWILYRIFIDRGILNWFKELRVFAVIAFGLGIGYLIRMLLTSII